MKKRQRDIMVPLGRAVATGERWSNLSFSIYLAGIVTFAAFVLIAVAMVSLAKGFDSAAIDPVQQEANHLAVLQVLTGFASFALTFGGLFFVWLEFVRNRAVPSLELVLTEAYSERERVAITLEHDGQVALVVRNHGNLTAQWFLLEFDVPFLAATMCEQARAGQAPLIPVIPASDRGSWHAVWYADTEAARLRFESDGALAVYPGAATIVGRLPVAVDGKGGRREYTCHYRISSDRQKPVSGMVRIGVDPKIMGVKVMRGPSTRTG